jgi:ribosomal protein S18 acetylase RimI-like enzyme
MLPWQGEVLRLRLEALLRADLKESLTVTPETLDMALSSALTDAIFVVDVDAGSLVGYAELLEWKSATGTAGYVENVVRARAYKGRGVGKILIDEIEKAAVRRKLAVVWLHSGAWRKAAHQLYTAAGYQEKDTKVLFKEYKKAR